MGMQVSALGTTAIKLADGTTLEASAGKLQIKNDGVTATKINVAGLVGATGKINAINTTNFSEVPATAHIQELYTGSGFDSHGLTAVDEQDHELTAIASADVTDRTYAIIKILGRANINGGDKVEVKIQSKEIAGAYADILAYQIVLDVTASVNTGELIYIHTLTAGEKTNGVQFKLFSKATGTGEAWFYNVQTAIILI